MTFRKPAKVRRFRGVGQRTPDQYGTRARRPAIFSREAAPSVAPKLNSTMELLPLAKGFARATVLRLRTRRRGSPHAAGGNISARYCYSVWMRHLIIARETAGSGIPKRVLELGPGLSLGTGFCARLSGVNEYIALDAYRDADVRHSLSLLPDLVRLMEARSPIPDESEFPEIWPRLSDYSFPAWLRPTGVTAAAAAIETSLVQATAAQLESGCGGIRYVAPWTTQAPPPDISGVDFLFSQAVFEHVSNVGAVHRAAVTWLAPGGLAAHTIDFRSHQLTRAWYGHWLYPGVLWRLVTAAGTNYLNRLPLSQHTAALQAANFDVLRVIPFVAPDGQHAPQVLLNGGRFEPGDLGAMGAYVCARLQAADDRS